MTPKVAKTPTAIKEHKGRQKGTPNKRSMTVGELCEKMGLNVIENLVYYAKGDYKSLGYPETVVRPGFAGIEIEEFTITPEQRYKANVDLAKFIYPTRKATDVSVKSEESNGFSFQYVPPKQEK